MQGDREKAFLDYLSGSGYGSDHTQYSGADKLLPWIVREWKKGRMVPHNLYPHSLVYDRSGDSLPVDADTGLLDEGAPYGVLRQFPTNEANETVKALEDMKKHRKGLDVMQHKAHELVPKVKDFRDWQKEQDRDKRGEILHRFDDGWTVRRLQNAEEAEIEGEDMGHCVGGYGQGIEDGRYFITSLRDKRGNPHATMQLHDYDQDEDGKPRPTHGMSVGDFYGKEDQPPLDEYTERMNEWLDRYGARAESFEPWWPEEYGIDGPDNYGDLVGHHNHGYYEYAPDDYSSAQIEAEEHGLEGPSLYLESGPYWASILKDLQYEREYNQQIGRWEDKPVPFDRDKADTVWNLAHVGTPESDKRYTEGGWQGEYEGPRLQEAVDDLHGELLDEYNQKEYQNSEEARKAWESKPTHEMVDYFKGREADQLGQSYEPPWRSELPQVAPNQQLLWHPPNPDLTYKDWPEGGTPLTQEHYGAITGRPPLYYRWVFTPEQGVTLSSNDDDHPSRVPYHTDLGGLVDQQAPYHGYAYRIGDGWRLTDWEHGAVEDPFIAAQVVRALKGKDGFERTSQNVWEPVEYDWNRLHYGLPEPKVVIEKD